MAGRVLAATPAVGTAWTDFQLAVAAQLSVPGAVISHHTAGRLHGFPLGRQSCAHVISDRRHDSCRNITIHRLRLDAGEIVTRTAGLSLTHPQRTALDLLGSVPFDEALDLWAWLSSRKILDSAALESAVERRGKWVGSAKVSALLRITRSGAVSKAELRLHSLLHDAGLTSWDAGVTVTDERGVVGVVDLIFPSARLIVEVDGFLAHSSHRSFVEDRRRQNRLVAAGYTVLRFTWDDLTQHPTKVIATIRRHLPPGVGLRAAM